MIDPSNEPRSQDQIELPPQTSTTGEGGSVPFALQMPEASEADAGGNYDSKSNTFMSPQSHDASHLSAPFAGQISADRSLHDEAALESLNVSQTAQRKSEVTRVDQKIPSGQNKKIMPGAPLLEAALSQKEFIIKKSKSKRGSSKGANYMKAYFPNLIAKKDVSLITPNSNGAQRLSQGNNSAARPAHVAVNEGLKGIKSGQNSNSAKQQRKFVQMSRSQHGSSNNTSGIMHSNYGQAHSQDPSARAHYQAMKLLEQQRIANGGEIIMPADFQTQNVYGADGNLIVVDDYQRRSLGVSQDGPIGVGQMRKQKSITRASDIQGVNQHPGNQMMQKRMRRNSLEGGSAAKKDNRHMLPPIFSGPQKKQSQKSKQLIAVAPIQSNKSQYNTNKSDCSPLQYKSETQVVAALQSIPNSDRHTMDGSNLRGPKHDDVGAADTQAREDEFSPTEGHQKTGEDYEEIIAASAEAAKPKVDFVSKNAERLRAMQEQRAKELKDVEEQRAKMLRRQEKLKQNVLRDAQAYRQLKATRQTSNDAAEDGTQTANEIKLGNIKNEQPRSGFLSPKRVNQPSSNAVTSLSATRNNLSNIEEEKNEEQKAEEKKKLEMMRKFYRNRHSSFLQALAQEKSKKENEEKAKQEAAEKKKQKITQKVLGDGSRIRAKVFESGPTQTSSEIEQVQVPPALANINKNQLNATSKSTNAPRSTSKSRVIRRGNSVSSLTQAEKAYNDTSTVASSATKRQNQGSRGSTRAASSKGGSETKTSTSVANRSAQNFSKGGILTPKVQGSNKMGPNAGKPDLTEEERVQFDEKREEEILKQAAEKKARALAIRERQEKQLQAIKDKVRKEKASEQAEIERKKKLQELAREQVQMRAEQIKNLPSLREQQESRLKQRNQEDGKDDKDKVTSPTPAKPRNTVADAEAFNNFLERNKTMMKAVSLNITDMKEWKKKNRVEPETKVFIVKGGYGDVRRALKQRGWVENKDKDSPCFDFKWTLMTKDIPHNDLQSHQLCNHFPTATSITTKVGLTHSLKNLIWFNCVDIDTFYPRCYDLAIGEELEDFIQEFKQNKAVSYMKIYVREMREAFAASGNSMTEEIKSKTVTDKIYKVAMKICKNRTRDLDDLIDDPQGFMSLVSENEWAILSQDEHTEDSLAAKKHKDWLKKQEKEANQIQQPKVKTTKKDRKEKKAARNEATKAKRDAKKAAAAAASNDSGDEDDDYDDEYDDEYGDYDDEDEPEVEVKAAAAATTSGGATTEEVKEAPADGDDEQKVFAASKQSEKEKEADRMLGERYPKFAEAVKVLDTLRQKYPQFNVDGERNIWIMKPAGSSRGRGICLKRDLCEILDMVRFKDKDQCISNQKNGQLYICQKYIENTLIMKCRKFDIRQWVLVTDWNPLTIWVYAEPYIRFPAADFDFNKINNRYSHLSNNSVAKKGKVVQITHHIDGNMWDLEQFQSYLLDTYGFDVWEDKIVESIKNIVINSLESVQDNFDRKNGTPFEMFGYDIMVDDDFNCWLIEVNSSPAMDYSTDVTERLVKMVLEDTIKVVVDYGMASPKKQKRVDTGGFECVYKAKRVVDRPMNSFGINMEVVGKKIPRNHLKKY